MHWDFYQNTSLKLKMAKAVYSYPILYPLFPINPGIERKMKINTLR